MNYWINRKINDCVNKKILVSTMLKIYLKNDEVLELVPIKVHVTDKFIGICTKEKECTINIDEIRYMTETIKKKTTKELVDNVVKSNMKLKPTCFGNDSI